MAKGWFKTKGRDGDRTVEQQMVGLEPLVALVKDKSVLDVGCAEGLVAMKLVDAGATDVHGFDSVHELVRVGDTMKGGRKLHLFTADANTYKPSRQYDVVLLLAILHKLGNPSDVATRFAAACAGVCVVRLPPTGELIVDRRSGENPHSVTAAMKRHGLNLVHETRGTFDEWIGYYSKAASLQEALAPAAPPAAAEEPAAAPAPAEAPAAAPAPEAAAPAPSDDEYRPRLPEVHQQSEETAPPYAPPPTDPEPPAQAPVPPASVHPGGDPAVQLPVEKVEPLPLDGEVKPTIRRTRPVRQPSDLN